MPDRLDPNDLEREAIQRRISARMFGESSEPVRIGRFQILGVLGRGGMGVVYSARDDMLGREVALKLIDGLGPGECRERLLAEARAQAQLSHPNVVPVHEVGDSEGRVFIVMELVRGTTLDRWLAAAPRSLAEILAAFVAAGRGLAAAHALGLVHRDVKPGNILVGADGRVRIADFGLARDARPLDVSTLPTLQDGARGARDTTPPSVGGAAGTPAYMAPEQREGRPDARSDQYSLCVSLHEALHRRRPLDPAAPPATRARNASDHVPRGLQKILARGLARDPADRFPSVDALLAALEAASRPRGSHRGALAAAAAIVLAGAALLAEPDGGAAASTCPDDQEVFTGVWDPGRRVAVERAFLATDLPHAGAAFARLAGAVDGQVAGWHEARLRACREQTASSLRAHTETCLDHRRRELAGLIDRMERAAPRDVETVDAWTASLLRDPVACLDPRTFTPRDDATQAALDEARVLRLARRGHEALPRLEEVLAACADRGDRACEAEALLLRGQIEARELEDPARAVATLERARNGASASRRDLLWEIFGELARIHARDREDAAEARDLLGQARSNLMPHHVDDDLVTARLLDTESHIALVDEQFQHALELRHRALALRRRRLPPEHPEILESRLAVAGGFAEAGRLREALALQQELFAECVRRFGPSHLTTALALHEVALTHLQLEEYDDARAALLRVRETLVRLENPRVGSVDVYLAEIDLARNDRASAESFALAALRTLDAHFPANYSPRIRTLGLLAEVYREKELHEKALAVTLELAELLDGPGVELDPVSTLNNIGDFLCELGRWDEALPYYRRLDDHLSLHPPEDGSLLAYPRQGFGRVRFALGDYRAAALDFEAALKILRPFKDPASRVLAAQTARNLARTLRKLGARRRARELEDLAATLEADP